MAQLLEEKDEGWLQWLTLIVDRTDLGEFMTRSFGNRGSEEENSHFEGFEGVD